MSRRVIFTEHHTCFAHKKTSIAEQKINVLFFPDFTGWSFGVRRKKWRFESERPSSNPSRTRCHDPCLGGGEKPSRFSFFLLLPTPPPALLLPFITAKYPCLSALHSSAICCLLLHLPQLSLFRLPTLPSFFHTVSDTFTSNYYHLISTVTEGPQAFFP